jgi:hypothetical protein
VDGDRRDRARDTVDPADGHLVGRVRGELTERRRQDTARHARYFADYATAGKGGGHNGPELVYEHYAAFITADGEADEVVAEFGFAEDAPGAYDRAGLSFARSDGATMDLYDVSTGESTPNGRTVTLGPFEWTAASGPYVFGK